MGSTILERGRAAGIAIALALALAALAWGGAGVAAAQQGDGARLAPGALFGMTNDATGNEVVAYRRAADGTLSDQQTFATGGLGSGTIEDSANGLVLANRSGEVSPNNLQGTARFLFATNAGSDSISVFRVGSDTLELVEVQDSNGARPTSITVSKGVVYVMNSGGFMCSGTRELPNVTGFTLSQDGQLTPIPGSKRFLSGGPLSGCNQVSFNPRGDVLVATQQQFDRIDTFLVNQDGTLDGPMSQDSTGNGPFGFAFTQDGHLVTTENFGAAPGQGAAASYDVERDGTLTPISASVRNLQSDTCWLQITEDNKLAFATSFGDDGGISSYRVLPDGDLELIQSQAGTTGTGTADQALSQDSRYLYVLNSLQGTITGFRVGQDGTLTPFQTVDGGGALGQIGIAAI